MTGRTFSTDFPTANALDTSLSGVVDDVFVTKLDASGRTLVYSTYLGGVGGDWGSGIAVDSAGQAYVTGGTYSTNDFPTANPLDASFNGGFIDGFVAKIADSAPSVPVITQLTALNEGLQIQAEPFSEEKMLLPAKYRIEIMSDGQTIVHEKDADQGGTLATVIRGLRNGTIYLVKVFSMNNNQQVSTASATVSVMPQPVPSEAEDWANNFKYPILFLHGWNSSGDIWDNLAESVLKDLGWKREKLDIEGEGQGQPDSAVVIGTGTGNQVKQANIYTVTFRTPAAPNNPCVEAIQLKKFLDAVHSVQGNNNKVILVGHSQGGLVGRLYMQWGSNTDGWLQEFEEEQCTSAYSNHCDLCATLAERPNFFNNDILRLVTYGTPHKGLDELIPVAPWLLKGSYFIKYINDFDRLPLPDDVQIINLVGNTGVFSDDDSDCVVSTESQKMKVVNSNISSHSVRRVRHSSANRICGLLRTPEAQDTYGILVYGLKAPALSVMSFSPVSVVVKDPDGKVVSKERREIWGATYEEQADDSGHKSSQVKILFQKNGTYQINVVPDSGALPSDTFTLKVELNGTTTTLVDQMAIQNIPSQPFTFVAASQPACAADVSSQVNVSRSGFLRNRVTGRYQQTLTLKNTSANPLAGSVSLVLDNLSSNATLFTTKTGNTACATLAGSPYLNIDIGADNALSPGEVATVKLEFTNPANQPINYATRVLSGAGER